MSTLNVDHLVASPRDSTDMTTAAPTPSTPASATLSPTATYVNLTALKDDKDKASDKEFRRESTIVADQSPAASEKKLAESTVATGDSDRPNLSPAQKWGLLAMFSLAMFIDIWCYSAFFIFTRPISEELDIKFEQQSWVITSYAVTFAAFLLFWGRVSDLYSPKPVFTWGFLALGVLSLIISFLPDKYSFFVFRALAGIAGACLIPASYRLIVYVFPPEELGKAFTLYGMSGAISNVTGTLVAGFIEYIPNGGQMSAWRWFFRILAALIVPVSLLAFYMIPKSKGTDAECGEAKWRRLDLVGSLIMLFAIVLLILGLTLGASYGWKTAKFLVPFLLSWVLFPAFFVWEHYLPETHALLPTKTWKIPNFATFIAFGLQVYPWWGVNFLGLVETFIGPRGEKPIIAALRVLPEGIVAFMVTLLLTWKPKLVSRPRWTILVGMVFGIVGYVLMTRPKTFDSIEYWKFLFPGFIIGSSGMMASFTATNVGVMTSVPAEMSGVAGAVLQVSFQLGSAVGLGIQAGLLTVNEGGISNPSNVKASFYFQMGWCALWLVGFLALYRRPKNDGSDEEGQKVIIAH